MNGRGGAWRGELCLRLHSLLQCSWNSCHPLAQQQSQVPSHLNSGRDGLGYPHLLETQGTQVTDHPANKWLSKTWLTCWSRHQRWDGHLIVTVRSFPCPAGAPSPGGLSPVHGC